MNLSELSLSLSLLSITDAIFCRRLRLRRRRCCCCCFFISLSSSPHLSRWKKKASLSLTRSLSLFFLDRLSRRGRPAWCVCQEADKRDGERGKERERMKAIGRGKLFSLSSPSPSSSPYSLSLSHSLTHPFTHIHSLTQSVTQ